MLMRTMIALLAIPLYFATPIAAGGGASCPSGSYWAFGKDTVKIDVIEDPNKPNGAVTQATGAGGISGAVNGWQGADSTPALPTAWSSGIMTLPNGDEVCIKGGKPHRRHPGGGPWTPGKKVKNPKKGKKNNTSAPRAGGNIHGIAGSPSDDVIGLPQ